MQDEGGNSVVHEGAGIEFDTIPANGHFKLLQYIDPYGDTYFNRVQMGDFLRDWDSLLPDVQENAQWTLVRKMAIRCRDEVHLYLRFIGD